MDLTVSDDDCEESRGGIRFRHARRHGEADRPSGTQQIEIRKNKDDYYAKSSMVAGVYKVHRRSRARASTKPGRLPQQEACSISASTIRARSRCTHRAKSYTFQKGGEDWFSNGKKLDSISVQSFLDKLRDLSASKFIDTGELGAPTHGHHGRFEQRQID